MADRYNNFAELDRNETLGRDYRIETHERFDRLIIAPHAGGIEPGTSEIARRVAGDRFSLYLFEGVKARGNRILHITSHNFDEPQCMALASRSRVALTVHGCEDRQDSNSMLFIGGTNVVLRGSLVGALNGLGFRAEIDTLLTGTSLSNVCNLPREGGVQLEIASTFRAQMFESLDRAGRRTTRALFARFCNVLSEVFSNI